MKLPFLLTAVILLILSCRFGETESLTVEFPPSVTDFPLSPEQRDWTLQWCESGATPESRAVHFGESASCEIEVYKETPVVCLLIPSGISEHFSPYPAGGLFVPGEDPVIELSWKDGAGAEFLIRALQGGMDLSSFNSRRFLSEIKEKEVRDPWQMDWALLERRLAGNEMKSWYLREKHRFDLEIPLPQGLWFSRSLFLEPLEQSSSGRAAFSLTEGDHHFFDPLQNLGFAVAVDDRGEFFQIFYED